MENMYASAWKRKTIAFLSSQWITLFGSSLVQMAMIWYVTLQTSSGIWVMVLTLCAFVPQMIVSLFAGVWADRCNRKMLVIAADSIIAAATLGLALFMMAGYTGRPTLVAILVVSFIRSLGSGIQIPTVNAMLPQLVPAEKLMRFNGINSSMQSMVQFAAPAVAGAIMAFGSLNGILMIDVLTAIVGVTLLAFISIPEHCIAKERKHLPFWADLKEGIRFSFAAQFVGKLLVIYGAFIFLCVPSSFLTALMIERTFGGHYMYLSVNEMVGCAGMVLSGLLLGAGGGFQNRNKTFFWGILSYAVFAILLGIVTRFWLFVAIMFFISFAIPLVQASVMTMLQEKVAPEMQGRVFSLLNIMFCGFIPLGVVIFGPMADSIPMHWLIIGTGVVLLLLAISIPCSPSFYQQGVLETKEE